MLKSTASTASPGSSEPRPPSLQSLRLQVALRSGFAVLLAGLLAVLALIWSLATQFHAEAQAGQQAIARSVVQTLANQTTRAVRLGIPLQKLPGVQDYLQQTLQSTPQIAYLALADEHGKPLYSVSQGKAEPLVKLPIIVRGATVAQVQAGAKSPQAHSLIKPAALAALTVLTMAVLAGFIAWQWPGRGLQKRHALLLQALRETQTRPIHERHAGDAQQAALQALSELQQRNAQAQQDVQDFAAELLAVDFDQKMHSVLKDIAPSAIKIGAAS